MATDDTVSLTPVTFLKFSKIWNETQPAEHNSYNGHDAQHLPLYEYDSINVGQFRLLYLKPGSGKQQLEFELKTVAFDGEPVYEAVSYCWGEPPSCNVVCNGSRLAVTKNGVDALWHFRLTNEPRVLWMDVICINQKNKKEKSEQVTDMHKIYGGAQRTLAFAGNAAPHDQGLFRFLKDFNAVIRKDIISQVQATGLHERNARVEAVVDGADDWVTWSYLYFSMQDVWDKGVINQSLDNVWLPVAHLDNDIARQQMQKIRFGTGLALLKLCAREYFHRAWVLQELVLSKHSILYIGKNEMPWDDFAASVWIISLNSESIPGIVGAANTIAQIHQRRAVGALYASDSIVHFSVMLSSLLASGLRSHKPVDRLYAMRNLGGSGDGTAIPVNYNQSTIETYYQIFRSAMVDTNAEARAHCLAVVLAFTKYTRSHESGVIPSWLPDFGALTAADVHLMAVYGVYKASKHVGHLESAHFTPNNLNVLALRGAITDSIHSFSDIEPGPLRGPDGIELEDYELAEYKANDLFQLTFVIPSWIDFFRMMSTEAKPSPRPKQLQEHIWSKLRILLSNAVRRLKIARDFAGKDTPEEKFWGAFSCNIDPRTSKRVVSDKPFPGIDAKSFLDATPSLTEPSNWTTNHPIAQSLPIATLIDAYNFLGRIGHWRDAYFGRTESGRLAWLPSKAKLGDKICLFGGSSTFHVIRPDPDTEGCWKIIGPAFVHGLMDGEIAASAVNEKDDFLLVS